MTVWGSHPVGTAGALLVDEEIASLWSPDAEIEAMLAFERALAKAQREMGEISANALEAIERTCSLDNLDQSGLAEGVRRDGVVVPALIRQLKAIVGELHGPSLHRGATSQDVTDTALMIRSRRTVGILCQRLAEVVRTLEEFARADGRYELMARTRFQDALPFTLSDKVATWSDPLRDLNAHPPERFPLQLGGPIGLRAQSYGPHHREVAGRMAEALGLSEPGRSWHTDRRALGEVARWCCDVTTALGKFGQDVAILAQTSIGEIRAPGGGSSAMPHKNNPVAAELLVTLAQYTAANTAMLNTAALHENERSGIGWTLEWFSMPPVLLSCGVSLRTAMTLASGLKTGA